MPACFSLYGINDLSGKALLEIWVQFYPRTFHGGE